MPAGRGVVEPVLLRVAVRAEHQHVREVAQQSEQALAIGIAERVASGRLEQRDVHAQYQQALLRYGRQVGLERSEEHTSELQSLMSISYAVLCLKKQNILQTHN